MSLTDEANALAYQEMTKWGIEDLHFQIAVPKALDLARQFTVDEDVLRLGLAFMDIMVGRAIAEGRGHEHTQMGAERARSFLEKKLPEDKIQLVENCILAHHREVPFASIEAEICANADCYKFIHPKGFFMYAAILASRKTSFGQLLTQLDAKLDEKYKILSLEICKQELEPYYHTFKKYIADARALSPEAR